MLISKRDLSTLTLTFVVLLGAVLPLASSQNATSDPPTTQPQPVKPAYTVVPSTGLGPTTSTRRPMPSRECQLEANSGFREELSQELAGQTKLVEIEIHLEGYPEDMLERVLVDVHRPNHWVRSANRQGRSLLMLDETYSYMSLSTLSIGVSNLYVNLTSHPPGCLLYRPADDLLRVIRESFLNDFKVLAPGEESGSLSADEHICNVHIIPNGDYAKFQYACCHNDPDGQLVCEEIVRNKWLTILMTLVLIIKIVVVLYSPMIVPESMYRLKYVAAQYIYQVPDDDTVSVKVVVTQDPEQYGPENKHKRIRLSQLKNMDVFKAMVGNSRWTPERVYEVKVKDVRLSVKARRLLAKTSMPITIMKLLYNNLLRCRIRKLEPLVGCCETNILGRFYSGTKMLKWSQLMRIVAGFIFLFILFIPWIIRVSTYLKYDEEIYEERQRAASDLGLDVEYSGSLVIYFSPLHGFFILIYFIFIFDSVIYGVISKPMKEKLKFVLRQCLRDMRERSRLSVLAWMTKLVVWPFSNFGLLGLIIFPVYIIIVLIFTLPIIAFYMFPTINLTVRLIIHLFIFMCPPKVTDKFNEMGQKLNTMKEKLNIHEVTANESFIKRSQYTTKGIAFQLIIIIMCLITFWSLTLLIMEVSSFFVELLVYTFMGVIVNAAITMKFVTVFFLLYLYGKQIFSSVSKEYLDYHKVVHEELLKMKRPEINKIARKDAFDQENTAFRVTGAMATNSPKEPEPVIKVKDHQPQWETKSMLIFLDKFDNPLTPERFFFETIDLSYCGCPGPIYKQVVDAVLEFSKVIIFLMFVFVVVMAFGDAYQVSTTNQLLATVAGGFVPFLFRYIFKADTGGSKVDTESIQFLTEFHKAINQYRQSWSVFDINPDSVEEFDPDAKKAEAAVDGNGNQDGNGETSPNDIDPDSSGAPLLNSTEIDINESSGNDKAGIGASVISMEEMADVDIIVDISSPKTRSVNTLLTTGFEKGSQTMLDYYNRSSTGGSARMYKPHNERAIDVV